MTNPPSPLFARSRIEGNALAGIEEGGGHPGSSKPRHTLKPQTLVTSPRGRLGHRASQYQVRVASTCFRVSSRFR
jgi:hypothetical protein